MRPSRHSIGFTAAFALAGCLQAVPTGPKSFPGTAPSEVFQSRDASFSIRYPRDWTKVEKVNKNVVLFQGELVLPDEVALGVIVATLTPGIPQETALEQYAGGYQAQVAASWSVLASGSASLSGQPALTVDHTIKEAGKEFLSRQFMTVKGDRVYQLNFLVAPTSSFNVWLPTATAMADSFQLLE